LDLFWNGSTLLPWRRPTCSCSQWYGRAVYRREDGERGRREWREREREIEEEGKREREEWKRSEMCKVEILVRKRKEEE
jgi:hypothetical protein